MGRFGKIAFALAAILLPSCLWADEAGFAKKHVFGIWSKDRFADAVVVTGPAKTFYLSGMGAEDEVDGHIRHLDSFLEQCRYAHAKIMKVLAKEGATFGSVVKTVTYITDIRYLPDYRTCRREAVGTSPLSTHTLLVVSNLAHPGMLVEVDVTAVVPK